MKNISITDLKEISKKTGYPIMLAVGYNEGQSCVATYGKTQEDCDAAAQAGNWIKEKMLQWPLEECVAEPNRVKKMKEKIAKQKLQIKNLETELECFRR